MVGESNHDRAYLMALSAWKTFGHTSEPHSMFARRIAVIGEAKGLNVAAEAIAEDCREKGLQMSAHRVLKCLADTLERHREQLRNLKSIEEFQVEKIGELPPCVAAALERLRTPSEPKMPWGCLAVIIALGVIGWLILR